MRIAISLLLGCLGLGSTSVLAQRVSPDTPVDELAQGEFVWNPEASPAGPVVVLVSLNKQQAFVYRNGIVIGYTDVSTRSEERRVGKD